MNRQTPEQSQNRRWSLGLDVQARLAHTLRPGLPLRYLDILLEQISIIP